MDFYFQPQKSSLISPRLSLLKLTNKTQNMKTNPGHNTTKFKTLKGGNKKTRMWTSMKFETCGIKKPTEQWWAPCVSLLFPIYSGETTTEYSNSEPPTGKDIHTCIHTYIRTYIKEHPSKACSLNRREQKTVLGNTFPTIVTYQWNPSPAWCQ